ncbi:MBOAT family O-acyltransferase [Butyrivibrio sp. WCE2006]|uniref:MBOAT family O-acyltransferase n=1 Tax=Butyrivibrio sp. WCE2006 TaxID=1410611 RepID=UPI0006785EB0
MTFNSYSFIFIFLPVFLLGIWGIQSSFLQDDKKGTLMKLWLIVMSAFFFVGYGRFSILIFSFSILWNLLSGLAILRSRGGFSKYIKAVAIVGDVALLGYFKYLNAGAMPVAISFYTFSQIMFIAELNKEEGLNIIDYLCYVLFFPKILQGPIADYENIRAGIFDLHKRKLNSDNIAEGLRLFTLGLVKKVLLADILGKAVDFGYQGINTATALDALVIAVSYSFQLYFDFSGYCDMAEGICKMIGMDLRINFDSPYKSGNISEFWDRWHISLTRFFTKYIYIPLGGSRRGIVRTCINIMVVFLISGIWHGNGWGFVLWGCLHGLLMVLTRLLKGDKKAGEAKKSAVIDGIKTLLTFLYVTAAWVFFRAPGIDSALALLGKIINIDAWRGFHISIKLAECFMVDEIWYIFKVTPIPRWDKSNYICMWIIIIISALIIIRGDTARKIAKKRKAPIIYGLLFVWGVLSLGGVSTFLYVNF